MDSPNEDIHSQLAQVLVEIRELRASISPAAEIGGMELAQELLGLSPYTIREKCREGILPHTRTGRSYRFLRADLLRYLQQNHQPGASAMATQARHHTRRKTTTT